METIKQQQQLILLQLQRIQSSGADCAEVPNLSDLGFPVSSLEHLARVEGRIAAQSDLKNKLITFFGLSGGMTTKETVWRVLAKALANDVAKKIKWQAGF
ncbi:hypothetical protein SKAU_G00322570 [Synaphobranchus kaupii]|uniref:DUF4806 domain-containing protein n=1 Tax=Synaphobranchus kaupii TaxID=118154 RepID=A0A9Q1IK16_SYNKA|nr:hypothetical protein SKAU_G00322570 [Synaphobranchus kaupii]